MNWWGAQASRADLGRRPNHDAFVYAYHAWTCAGVSVLPFRLQSPKTRSRMSTEDCHSSQAAEAVTFGPLSSPALWLRVNTRKVTVGKGVTRVP